jgi:hypothetical protein
MNEAITLEEHRRREAAGALPKQKPHGLIEPPAQGKHGIMHRHRQGCRCEPCVAAAAAFYASPKQMAAKKIRNEKVKKKRAAERAALKKQGAKQ